MAAQLLIGESTRSTDRGTVLPPNPWCRPGRSDATKTLSILVPRSAVRCAPTAAPPGGRLPRHAAQVSSSHGAPFARAHCSTSRCRASAALAQVPRPTERRSLAPTAAPPGGRLPRQGASPRVPRSAVRARPLQHLQVAATAASAQVSRPTERRSRAPTAAPPGDRLPRHTCKSSRPTEQPFARAHCSTSRWPPRAATAQVHSSTERRSRAPTAAPPGGRLSRLRASLLVPRSAVRARPLQHLQVSRLRGMAQVHSSHGAPFARAHCSTSRWPPSAAKRKSLVPRRSRSRAPTAAPPGGRLRGCGASPLVPRSAVRARPLQHLQVAAFRGMRASLSSHGAPFARTHCSTSRWPPSAAARKSSRPTERRSRAPTAAPPGGRPRGMAQVFSSHGAPFARAHCSTSRWPPCAAKAQVTPSHGAPLARAHCSTSRWPPSAASRQVTRPTERRSRAPTAAPRGGRLSRHRGKSTRSTERRCARPLQHLQVAVFRGCGARLLVPRSAVRRAPTEAPPGGRRSRHRRKSLVPRASFRAQPLQHLQVAASRGVGASPSSHGHPRSFAHLATSTFPPLAMHVNVSRPTDTLADPSPTPACRLDPTKLCTLASSLLTAATSLTSPTGESNTTSRIFRFTVASTARSPSSSRESTCLTLRRRARPRRVVPEVARARLRALRDGERRPAARADASSSSRAPPRATEDPRRARAYAPPTATPRPPSPRAHPPRARRTSPRARCSPP